MVVFTYDATLQCRYHQSPLDTISSLMSLLEETSKNFRSCLLTSQYRQLCNICLVFSFFEIFFHSSASIHIQLLGSHHSLVERRSVQLGELHFYFVHLYLLYFKVKIQPRWWPEGARTGWPAGTDFGRRDFRLRCGATAHPWDWMKYKYKYKREILQYKNFVYETFNVAEAWGHLHHQWVMQMWKKLQRNTI